MKRFLACAAAFIGLVQVSGAATAQPAASLPVFFMENRGQADPQVKFMVKRQDFSAYLLEQEIILSWGSKQVPLRLVGAQKPRGVGHEFCLVSLRGGDRIQSFIGPGA